MFYMAKKVIKNVNDIKMTDFNKRARQFGYIGNAVSSNGVVTNKYIRYLNKNKKAPRPKGYVLYQGKFIDRQKLVDKRSKDGRLRPSGEKNILGKLRGLLKYKEIKFEENKNFGTGKFSLDVNIPFLNVSGRDMLSDTITRLTKSATTKYDGKSSKYVLILTGKTIFDENVDGKTKRIFKDFRWNKGGKRLANASKDFKKNWNLWIQNNNVENSFSDVVIYRVELRVIPTNQKVGAKTEDGRLYTGKVIDGIKIMDFKTPGINNCFFGTVKDWLCETFKTTRITPKICNKIRRLFKIKKDSKISPEECINICKKLFNKSIYIVNRYDKEAHPNLDTSLYDRVLFTMEDHIYLVENMNYTHKKCKLCGVKYIISHSESRCQKIRAFRLNKRYVIKSIKQRKEASNNKLVLHYDIETHTDNPEHQHLPYIVGYTHYDEDQEEWIYGTFEGKDCMSEFYEYARKCPKIQYLHAYNGNRFDHFFLAKLALKDTENMKSEIVCNNGGILKLTIPKRIEPYIGPDGKAYMTNLVTCDLNRHIVGSLAKNLKNSGCQFAKGEIDHNISTYWEQTDLARKQEVREYLYSDVMGLKELYDKYDNVTYDNYGVNICDYMTGSQLCYSIWNSYHLDGEVVELPNAMKDTFIRRSVYGGRCYPNKRDFKSHQYDDIINEKITFDDITDYLIDGDIVSLYPYVMTFEYPVGFHINTKTYKEGYMGIYKIKYITNKKLLTVPIPRRDKDGLKWDLQDSEGVYTSVDIERAKSVGYEIEVIEGIYWENTAPIYKSYMLDNYKKKASSTKGTPQYQTYKNNLNALYGKQIQKPNFSDSKIIYTKWELLNIVANNLITDIQELDERKWLITYEPNFIVYTDEKITKPCHQGAFILAYSRDVMWKYIVASGGLYDMCKLFYYTDTDSIQLHIDACKDIKWGENMGDISNDLGDGAKIIRGVWIQPKFYMLVYVTRDMKIHYHFRGAGVPEKQLNPEVYDELLQGKDRKFLPDFMMKRNLFEKKNRRYNDGGIVKTDVELFSIYHYNNTDVNKENPEELVLEKTIGCKDWLGRKFISENISYPIGYEY